MENISNKASRLYYMDILNIMACICVVVMHCTNRVNLVGSGRGWYLAILLQALCIWAVTAFYMLSGANLLDYRAKYSTKDFLKKRVCRILIPFLIWSVIYALWKKWTGQLEISGLYAFLQLFAGNKILPIFWFFYTLIPAYFCIPFLSLVANEKNKTLAKMLFFLGLINLSIIPFINLICGLDFSLFRFPIGYSPICLLVLGWLLKHETISEKMRRIIYICAAASIYILFHGTIVLSKKNHFFDKSIMNSGSIFAICIASALFLLLKESKLANWMAKHTDSVINQLIRTLASASLGVYFVQIIIRYYINKLPFIDCYSIKYSILGSIFIYIISVCVVLLFKKIPIIKVIVP